MSIDSDATRSDRLLNAYSTDSRRLSDQLGFILVIRGWAITLFTAILGASVLGHRPDAAILNFLVLGIFYYVESTYDAFRFLLFKRVLILERELIHMNVFPAGFTSGFTDDQIDALPSAFPDALCRARTYPLRVAMYVALAVATAGYLVITM